MMVRRIVFYILATPIAILVLLTMPLAVIYCMAADYLGRLARWSKV